MTTTPQKRQPDPLAVKMQQLEQDLVRRLPRYAALLGGDSQARAFVQNAVAYVLTNRDILNWDRDSVRRAFMEVARIGLGPHGVIPGVHLVPFNSKKGSGWVTMAVPITDYKAEVALAMEAEAVGSVIVEAVYANDTFEWEFRAGKLHHVHRWNLDHGRAQRGALRGMYCIATNPRPGADPYTQWMNLADLKAFAARHASKKDGGLKGLWASEDADDQLTVFRKTVTRQCLRFAPRSAMGSRFAHAVAMDERSLHGHVAPPEDAGMMDADYTVAKGPNTPTDEPPEQAAGAATRAAVGAQAPPPDDEPPPDPPADLEPDPAPPVDPEPDPVTPEPEVDDEPAAPATQQRPVDPPEITFDAARAYVLSFGRYGQGGKTPAALDAVEDLTYLDWARGCRQATDVDRAHLEVYLTNDLIQPALTDALAQRGGPGASAGS